MLFQKGCCNKSQMLNNMGNVLILCSLLILQGASENKKLQRNTRISRDHVSVWFESPLQTDFEHRKENLKEMINLISATYGGIVIKGAPRIPYYVAPESKNDSVLLIPELVAEHNRKADNENKLKVIVSFDSELIYRGRDYPLRHNRSMSEAKSIEVAKYIADRANAIYPGTVDTLLLHNHAYIPFKKYGKLEWGGGSSSGFHLQQFYHQTLDRIKSALDFLHEAAQESDPQKYKLGLTIPFGACGNERMNASVFSEIIQNIDVVIPSIYFHEAGNSEEQEMIKATFENCEQILKNINKEVKTFPLISCNPTETRDFAGRSQFLSCWQQISNWANEHDRKIIMYEAFDRFDRYHVQHVGWWRLKSEDSQQKLTASSFVALPDEKLEIGLKAGIPFNENVAVYFDHSVRHYPQFNSYAEKEIQQMLGLISTRFSTIVAGYQQYEQGGNSEEKSTSISKIVANLNLENEFNPSFQKLSVISNVYSILDNANSSTISKPWISRRPLISNYAKVDFIETLKLAREANNIFPDSVTTIAYYKVRGKYNWATLRTALSESASWNISSIRLGTYVDLTDCEMLKSEFQSVSQWLSVVIVEIAMARPITDQLHSITSMRDAQSKPQYMDAGLRKLFAEWNHCRISFNTKFPEVDVMLTVDCTKILHGEATNEQIARCWEMVSEFGKENQVKVILYQAFDTPYPTPTPVSDSHVKNRLSGWWQLKRKSEVNITADSFQEKFQDVFLKFSEQAWNSSSYDKDDGHAVMVISLVALIVLGIILAILLLLLYKRRMFLGLGKTDLSELQVLSE